jgi:hypothetical protein
MPRKEATGITISPASNAVDMLALRDGLTNAKLVVDVLFVGVSLGNKRKKEPATYYLSSVVWQRKS